MTGRERSAGRATAAAVARLALAGALLVAGGCTGRGDGTAASTSPPPSPLGQPPSAGTTVTPPGVPVPGPTTGGSIDPARALRAVTSWVYQLQGYPEAGLDALARAPQQLAVIDLARDASTGYFTAADVAGLRRSGKLVLAYMEIGSIEQFRPEYPPMRDGSGDMILNRWPAWPEEFFVRYWDQRWWDQVVRPRLDQAARAGFDGVYLDTPLAYEQIDLTLVPGRTRDDLGRAMADLIVRIGRYADSLRPGMLVVPQNSPELRRYSGYLDAIDGIGMEELFYLATDDPCTADWCAENLAETRAILAAGKAVLAVDYATRPDDVRSACARYRREGFAGYVTTVDLDQVGPPCG